MNKSPNELMGVFKRLEDVPDRYRLYHHQGAYEGQDVWSDFVETRSITSQWATDSYELTERTWNAHMDERERHHALARPIDVETYLRSRLTERTRYQVYRLFWMRLEHFYSWLQHHTHHPHVYHPVFMAAENYEIAARIWEVKIEEHDRD